LGRYLDIVRRVSQASGEVCPYEINEQSSNALTDAYAEKFRTAIRSVNSSDCPAGLIKWLRETYPILYLELVDTLPNEIHRLWSEHAPLEEFERILDVWVEAHRTACEMLKASETRNCDKPALEKSNR
jgi:hypothetical protein